MTTIADSKEAEPSGTDESRARRAVHRLAFGAGLIIAMAAVFTIDALVGSPVCVIVLANFAVLGGLLEYNILATGCGARPYRRIMVLAGMLVLNWSWLAPVALGGDDSASVGTGTVIVAVTFIVSVAHMSRRRKVETAFAEAGATLTGVLYVALPLAVFLALAVREGSSAWRLLLWILASAKAGDMAACTIGNVLGKHKLAPATSPNKTIEGAAASFAASLATSILTGVYVAGVSWQAGLVVGVVVSIAAQMGDLVESALKRSADIKDSGSLLPAFGGVLDLLDSLIFSLPMGAVTAELLGELPL